MTRAPVFASNVWPLDVYHKMKTIKSQSVYLNITQALLADVSSATEMQWFTPSDAKLTFCKVVKRYEKEGLSFLTKTLPRFGKALDKALSGTQQFVVPGFRKIPGSSLPKFLGELTSRVFESDGRLKTSPCIVSITFLRLITNLWKKLELKYNEKQENSVLASFTAAEDELVSSPSEYPPCPGVSLEQEECDHEPATVSDLAAYSCVTSQRNHPGNRDDVVERSTWQHWRRRDAQRCSGSRFRVKRPDGESQPHRANDVRRGLEPFKLGYTSRHADVCQQSGQCNTGGHYATDERYCRALWSEEHGILKRNFGTRREDDQDAGPTHHACNQITGRGGAAELGTKGTWEDPVPLTGTRWGNKPAIDRRDLIRTMTALLKRLLCNVDPTEILPSHGSGAVSHGELPWEKRIFKRYYTGLAAVYPYDQYMYWSASHLCDEVHTLQSLKVETPYTRVVLVPKDNRGPRVISCEPLEMMWIQQGLMRVLYKHVEGHPLTRDEVHFTDQSVNNRLARQGSIGGYATLDLKEASDRVSLSLVRQVFPSPLKEALVAARSYGCVLPNGRHMRFRKYAPMGSSLCFPVLALVVWAAGTAMLLLKYSDTKRVYKRRSRVYVYGDDVITHSEDATDVITALEAVGLTINRDKSYITGQFKESCGGFYFRGHDVSGISIRTPFSHRRSPEAYASWIEYSNQFWKLGCRNAAGVIADELRAIYSSIPICSDEGVTPPCPALRHYGGRSVAERPLKRRWNRDLQRFEVHVLTLAPRKERRPQVGWCDVLEWASKGSKPCWPVVKTEWHGNMRYFVLDSTCSGTTVGNTNPHVKSTKELNPCMDDREYAMRRSSKLERKWQSGVGLT